MPCINSTHNAQIGNHGKVFARVTVSEFEPVKVVIEVTKPNGEILPAVEVSPVVAALLRNALLDVMGPPGPRTFLATL